MKGNIEVVAAIIQNEQKILCVQRGKSKYNYISEKYEFPGGKIEQGENSKQALCREIREELNMHIMNIKEFITVEHRYPDFSISLRAFECSSQSTLVNLSEHIDFKWLAVCQLEKLDWAEADIPIVEEIKRRKG